MLVCLVPRWMPAKHVMLRLPERRVSLDCIPHGGPRTPITSLPSATGTSSLLRCVVRWALSGGVALSRPGRGLVDGLGRRLGLPIGVELRVIACCYCQSRVSRRDWLVWCIPKRSNKFYRITKGQRP